MPPRPVPATLLLLLLLAPNPLTAGEPEDRLWAAARQGEVEKVQALLASGVDVNANTPYQSTALSFACSHGRLEVVRALLQAGAEVDVRDSFYGQSPLDSALRAKQYDMARLLLDRRPKVVDEALLSMARRKNAQMVRAILTTGNVSDRALRIAIASLEDNVDDKSKAVLTALEPHRPGPPPQAPSLDTGDLLHFVGTYESPGEARVTVQLEGERLTIKDSRGSKNPLRAVDANTFEHELSDITFTGYGERSSMLVWKTPSRTTMYSRIDPDAEQPPAPEPSAEQLQALRTADLAVSSSNWPQFRGTAARGVADGQDAPIKWDGPKGRNIKWKTPIPGLGLSCPVVWGDQVYLTTAVSEENDNSLRIGLYGDVGSVQEDAKQSFDVYCLDKSTGDVVWSKTAANGVPQVKRHYKSSHANPTIATDGKHVIAFFGGEGLYCYDTAGTLLWKKDLGVLDSGWFFAPTFQWGFGSSPIIHRNMVIVQCDVQEESFVAAFDLSTGNQQWRTPRDEIPTWSTPTVVQTPVGPQLITNGTRAARGYDADSGRMIWQLRDNSEIVVPTPFSSGGLTFLVSGYRPTKPIHAVRLNAQGDLTPGATGEGNTGAAAGDGLAWTHDRGGSYLPTPLVYRDLLYVCSNSGVIDCYHAASGRRMYRRRLRRGGPKSFTASPVASDGRLYYTAEDGHVYVVKAGREFRQLQANPLGEYCLATPAISQGLLLIRGQSHLFAVEQQLTVEELEQLEHTDSDDKSGKDGADQDSKPAE